MGICWPPSGEELSVRIHVIVGKTTFSDSRRLISTGRNITGCETAEANDVWACRGYRAVSRISKPCVCTYSASIEAGLLREQLISQSPNIKWGETRGLHYYGLLDSECMSAQ